MTLNELFKKYPEVEIAVRKEITRELKKHLLNEVYGLPKMPEEDTGATRDYLRQAKLARMKRGDFTPEEQLEQLADKITDQVFQTVANMKGVNWVDLHNSLVKDALNLKQQIQTIAKKAHDVASRVSFERQFQQDPELRQSLKAINPAQYEKLAKKLGINDQETQQQSKLGKIGSFFKNLFGSKGSTQQKQTEVPTSTSTAQKQPIEMPSIQPTQKLYPPPPPKSPILGKQEAEEMLKKSAKPGTAKVKNPGAKATQTKTKTQATKAKTKTKTQATKVKTTTK